MSLSVFPLSTVKVLEPRTKINSKRAYAVLKGGSMVSYKPITSIGSSPSSITFSANPPSPNIIVDRELWMTWVINMTFTGTSISGPLLQLGSNDAPRAFPIAQSINTASITMNDATVNINTNDVIGMLLRYATPRDVRMKQYSGTPSMLDQFQNYSEGIGTTKNVMGLYGDNGYEDPRGGFVGITNLVNPSGAGTLTASLTLEVTEPVFLSPWIFGGDEEAGFIGLQTLEATFTLNNLSRLWSHSSLGNPLSTISASFANPPQLLFTYITPDTIQRIPEVAVYPYFTITRYPNDFGTLAPNATALIESNNLQFQTIPRRVLLAARQRNTDLSYLTSDVFAGISSINVNFNGQSGLLSSATQQDLFNMSVRNGVDMDWNQWSLHVGSVLAVEFGIDIGLTPVQAPGMIGTFQFQVAVNIYNPNQLNSIYYTLYVVAINEGTFTITQNQCLTQIGILTAQDILNSASSPMVDYAMIKNVERGGNFFSSIKSFISKYLPHAKAALDVGKQAYALAKPVYDSFQKERGSGRSRGRGLPIKQMSLESSDDEYSGDDDYEPQYVTRGGLVAM